MVTLPKKLLPPAMTRMQEGAALELLGLIAVLDALKAPPLLVIVPTPELLPTDRDPEIAREPPDASAATPVGPTVRPPFVTLMLPPAFTFNRLPLPATITAFVPLVPMTNPVALTLRVPMTDSPGASPPKAPAAIGVL